MLFPVITISGDSLSWDVVGMVCAVLLVASVAISIVASAVGLLMTRSEGTKMMLFLALVALVGISGLVGTMVYTMHLASG